MTYLLSQLWLYLLCAGLLGLLLGWVIWGWWSRRMIADAKANYENERLSLERTYEAEKVAAFQVRDEAVKAKSLLLGEIESERKVASDMKLQLGRLQKSELAVRGEFERKNASLQEQLELERHTAKEAKGAMDAGLTNIQQDLKKNRVALADAENANETLRSKLESVEADVRLKQASLKENLASEQRSRAKLEEELQRERAELSRAKDSIEKVRAEMGSQVQAKDAALAKTRSEASQQAKVADSEIARLRSVEGKSETSAAGIDQIRRTMQQRIDEERRAKTAAETERSKLALQEREAKAEVERLRSQLSTMSTSGKGGSADADRLRRELGEARQRQSDLEVEVARLRSLLEKKETISVKSPEKKKFVTDAPRPASLFDRRPDIVDDLKEVKGIGPVMERILNENGCYHFKQLANFSPRDIEWISQALGSFPDRIERDEWVSQAQSLFLRKYGRRHDVGDVRTLETTS